MDIHPDLHQVVDLNPIQLPIELRLETGNMLVIGFQSLPVARHGFIVNADLLFQYPPALGQAGKQVRQAFECLADRGRGGAVLLQFAISVLMNALVNEPT